MAGSARKGWVTGNDLEALSRDPGNGVGDISMNRESYRYLLELQLWALARL